MSQSTNSDLDALNNLLSAFTSLQVAIQLVREHLAALQRQTRNYNLVLNENGEFAGLSYQDHIGLNEFLPADGPHCVEVRSNCEWLPKHVDSLWESRLEVDSGLTNLPARLTDRLDALTGSPWVATVRRHCIDKVLAWPGEVHHQTTYAAEKIHGNPAALLEKAAKFNPFPTWIEYERLILGYKADLIAIRDAVLPKPSVADAPDRSKLKSKQLAALEAIEKDGPILGKVLAKRIKVKESTLRSHIIPAIRPFGVTSGGEGYHIAQRSAT